RAVVAPRPGFDGDRLRRADRLAQFARDAALLAVGIAPQGVFAAKARRQFAFLVRIVQRRLRLEEIPHRQEERRNELRQEYGLGGSIEFHRLHPLRFAPLPAPARASIMDELPQPGTLPARRPRRPPTPARSAEIPSSRAASIDRSDNVARKP